MSEQDPQSELSDSQTPVLNTDPSARPPEPKPAQLASQVGRYLLLKQLGEGGMGVVYSAYDPDLDRKVALKLLRPDGRSDSDQARARLLREAQALARVSHPNVIPIFDVGIWGDQVFLAMEMVDGGTLSDWLKSQKRPWREVLERFLAAGRGLQAAHEAGLVHRDFKPANVLVSRTGRVYVTDFGLARQVGAPSPQEPLPEETQQLVSADNRMLQNPLTQTGLVMGTPNYMSPEQFRDTGLDARSDQFSFCAALYWGLYHQRAFSHESLRAFASAKPSSKALEHTAPLTPSRARPRDEADPQTSIIHEPPRDAKVPAWVKQAVMRGLALEPAERFPSMKELLDALSQEERRATRKRWGVAAAVTSVGLAVVTGGAYEQSRVCVDAGAGMDEVWSSSVRHKLEAAFQATGTPFAQDMAQRTSQVLEAYASAWKQQSTEACEATRVRKVQPELLLSRRLVCLERRRKNMRATLNQLTQADAALVTKALDAANALPSLQECEDVESLSEQQALPTEPSQRAEIEQLESQLAEVRAQVDAGRYKPAKEAVTKLEAPVLATGYLPLTAELRFHRGWLENQLGEPPEAAKLLSQAVYDAEAGHSDRLKIAILNKLLFVEDGLKHFPQAESWGGLAEATLHRIGGDPVLEADLKVNEANLAISQNHMPQARTLLEQARALQEKALAPGHPKRARVTFLLGRVLLDLGEQKRSVELLEEALQQTQASVGALHPDMAQRHGMLAGALREMKETARALEHARAAADIRKATFGATSLQYADSLDEVGMCLLELKRDEEALAIYQEALAAKQQSLPADDEDLQYSYDGVGQALLALNRPQEALEPLRHAVGFPHMDPSYLAESGFALARALWLTGQQEQARAEAARARERFTQAQLAPRAAEVDSWLASLSKAPSPSGR